MKLEENWLWKENPGNKQPLAFRSCKTNKHSIPKLAVAGPSLMLQARWQGCGANGLQGMQAQCLGCWMLSRYSHHPELMSSAVLTLLCNKGMQKRGPLELLHAQLPTALSKSSSLQG